MLLYTLLHFSQFCGAAERRRMIKTAGLMKKKPTPFFFNILRNCAFAVLARILAQITESRLRDDLVFAYACDCCVWVCVYVCVLLDIPL